MEADDLLGDDETLDFGADAESVEPDILVFQKSPSPLKGKTEASFNHVSTDGQEALKKLDASYGKIGESSNRDLKYILYPEQLNAIFIPNPSTLSEIVSRYKIVLLTNKPNNLMDFHRVISRFRQFIEYAVISYSTFPKEIATIVNLSEVLLKSLGSGDEEYRRLSLTEINKIKAMLQIR